MRKFKFLAFFLLAFAGCNPPGFYSEYQVDDLWRLPLVKPYELRNTAGAMPGNFYTDNWHLVFKNKIKARNNLFIDGVNLTMINVDKGIIYGYGTENPSYPFLINCNTGEEKIFMDVKEWEQALAGLGVDHKKLFDIFEAFENFKDKNVLPWKIPSN